MASEDNLNLPEGVNKAKLDQFIAFMQNEMDNPPKASELFIVPDKPMTPEWTSFFAKILKHFEAQCRDRPKLLKLQRRKRLTEEFRLSELEMIASATQMKFDGNEQFKLGKITKAYAYYMASLETFPMPDVMLNAAACTLDPSIANYSLAETYCTEALNLDLLVNPIKAYFRRSQARRHQQKFEEAAGDIKLALAIDPEDPKLRAEADLIEKQRTSPDVRHDADKEKPLSLSSFSDALGFRELVGHEEAYTRIPQSDAADFTKMQPPTF
ncbi:hypothetical protein D9757_002444 [Collybiopsis confluens]|uniref:Uncharacterized protein n=1 Tax=Collybiopsis confluens TaxID=2823264 RepID=A0A8H5HY20_9AGAR|nr:hypothetical protein D9757_002444 [Collybiopsis confluens]